MANISFTLADAIWDVFVDQEIPVVPEESPPLTEQERHDAAVEELKRLLKVKILRGWMDDFKSARRDEHQTAVIDEENLRRGQLGL